MRQNIIRKACQTVPAVVMAIAVAACDAHIEVPDTAVRPGHVLCTDGTALSYSEYEQSGKQAIAVVSIPTLTGKRRVTAMRSICGTLHHRHSLTVSASSKARRRTLRHMTGMRTPSRYTIPGKRLRRWPKRCLPCGGTDRVPTCPRWHRPGCCMRLVRPSILS